MWYPLFQLFLSFAQGIRQNSTQWNLPLVGQVNSIAAEVIDVFANVPIAQLAYCSTEVLKAWSCKPCQRLGNSISYLDSVGDTSGITRVVIFSQKARRQIFLAFVARGTIDDWLKDSQPGLAEPPWKGSGRINTRLKSVHEELQPKLLSSVTELLKQSELEDSRLIFVGHSVGGGLAVLSAIALRQAMALPWAQLEVFTYGQPRLGDADFAKWVNSLPIFMTRLVNENDPVPHWPSTSAGYYHHFTELYLEKGTSKLCLGHTIENPSCSFSRSNSLDLNMHFEAWGLRFGTDNC